MEENMTENKNYANDKIGQNEVQDDNISTSNKETKNETATEKVKKAEGFLKTLFEAKRVLFIAIIIVVGVFLFINLKTGKEGKISIAISSVLKDTNVISEFSTLIVPYNSICKVEEEKKKESDPVKFKYYTAYNGTVTLGLDFKKIDMKVNNDNKNVIIKLPKIGIIETQVDHNSIETIYVNEKYKTEGSFTDRRKECDDDLKYKASNEKHVYELAEDSAKKTITNLLKPIIDHIDSSYIVVFE